jgi:hypothetical protein
MRGNIMSAATNYELNDAATVGPSFITSEEATLLASARGLLPVACVSGTTTDRYYNRSELRDC